MTEIIDNKKITQIYDAIDNGNYSEAARLCNRPGLDSHPLTQSLLSYCYACMRKTSEAIHIASFVVDAYKNYQKPMESTIINTICQTYKVCKADQELVNLFENAVKYEPNDESHNVELFLSYNRLHEFKKMQLLAQKLYKLTNKSKYVFWFICSLLSQSEDQYPKAMLTVAEKMIKKIYYELDLKNFCPGCDELELLIDVLKRQEKHQDALDVYDDLSNRSNQAPFNDSDDFEAYSDRISIYNIKKMTLKLELLAVFPDKQDQVVDHLYSILSSYPDQWSAHTNLIDVLLIHNNIKLKDHLFYLKQLQINHPKLRGVYLAELYLIVYGSGKCFDQLPDECLDLCNEESSLNTTNKLDNKIYSLIINYIELFSTKQCCFSDLRPYLFQLSPTIRQTLNTWIYNKMIRIRSSIESILTLFLKLTEEAKASSSKVLESNIVSSNSKKSKSKQKKKSKKLAAESVSEVNPQESLNALFNSQGTDIDKLRSQSIDLICSFCKLGQISLFCRSIHSTDNSISTNLWTSNELVKLYLISKRICSNGIGGEREVQPGDELILILSSEFQRSTISRSSSFNIGDMLFWLSILQQGIKLSPHSYTFKLEVLEPLRSLCLIEPAVNAFNSMGIKHVQVDSLSYLVIPMLWECGFITELQQQYLNIITFHTSAARDTAENMARCFKTGNYMKYLELRRFVELCNKSSQLALAKSELPLLKLIERPCDAKEALIILQGASSDDKIDLVDTMDYELVIRTDLSISDETSEKDLRKTQYRNRISWSRIVCKMLKEIFQLDLLEAKGSLDALSDLQERIKSQDLLNINLRWSQKIHNGDDLGNDIIMDVTIDFIRLIIQLIGNECENEDSVIKKCNEGINALDFYLFNESSSTVMSPSFTRKCSHFIKSFGCWIPLILSNIPTSSLVSQLIRPVVSLLEKFLQRLINEENDPNKTIQSVTLHIKNILSTSLAELLEDNIDETATLTELVNQIVSSQSLILNRLKKSIKLKLDIL